jgi:hypothetical protein
MKLRVLIGLHFFKVFSSSYFSWRQAPTARLWWPARRWPLQKLAPHYVPRLSAQSAEENFGSTIARGKFLHWPPARREGGDLDQTTSVVSKISDHRRSSQIIADHRQSSHIIADHQLSSQIIANHRPKVGVSGACWPKQVNILAIFGIEVIY